MSTVVGAPNPEQVAAIEAPGRRLRLRGRRDGQDDRPRRAVRQGGLRARARRRLAPRHHLHGARRRRAARPHPRAADRGRAHRAGPRPRRRLDLDDPRLLLPPAQGAPVRGRDRSALQRPRRGAGAGAPARGVRGGADGVLRRRRPGTPRTARHVRDPGAAADADRRARDAPRSGASARPRARRAPEPGGADRRAARKRLAASWRTRTPASPPGPPRRARSSCSPSARCPSGCSTSAS